MLPPIPLQTDLLDRVNIKELLRKGMDWIPRMSMNWLIWFRALVLAVDATAKTIGSTGLTAQGAAIPTTPINLPALNTGLYRVTWYLRITRAAGTSSSAQLTLTWIDGGVAQSFTAAAVTGNTTATVQTGTFTLHLDTGTTLDYAVGYASVGAPTMQYTLSLVVETLP